MNDVTLMAQLDDGIVPGICQLFGCRAADIVDVHPLAGGNTNISFVFSILGAQDARGVRYVYRQPGSLTETFINRRAEKFACERAAELGVGEEIVFMDAASGVKVSRYVEQTREFDFTNEADVLGGALLLRKLHEARIGAPFVFDHLEQIEVLKAGMDEAALMWLDRLPDVAEVSAMVRRLDAVVKADAWPCCLIHGDPKGPNILVSADGYTLIDWEYAGVKDIGYDISHYAAEIGRARTRGIWELSPEDAAWYFGGQISYEQYRHVLACFAIEEFYWTVWAVKKSLADVVDRCYANARRFARLAAELYM